MHYRICTLLWLSCSLLSGCDRSAPSATANATESSAPQVVHNYELECDGLRHSEGAKLLCVRLNTRTGDAKLLDADKLPATSKLTVSEPRAARAYQLRCHTTTGAQGDAFHCLRLDRESGDVIRLALPKLAKLP